jgi:SPX domain protein involved in polyphosphate accumulation
MPQSMRYINIATNILPYRPHLLFKRKYIKDFLEENYAMEKTIRKMLEGAKNEEEIRSYAERIKEI